MSDKKAFAYFRVGNAEQISEATDNKAFLYCRQSYDNSHFMNQQQEHLLRHCADKGYQAAGSTAVVASAKAVSYTHLDVYKRQVLKNWYISNGFVHTGTKKFDHLPFTSGYLERRV